VFAKKFFEVQLTIVIGNICMEVAMDQTIIGSNRKIDPNRHAPFLCRPTAK
jgi:hypothetical protein